MKCDECDEHYDDGYNSGFSNGESHAEDIITKEYDEKLQELVYKLQIKDCEIEELLLELQELRKANEKLQRTIKNHSIIGN